mgnify:CR=1 FL=1
MTKRWYVTCNITIPLVDGEEQELTSEQVREALDTGLRQLGFNVGSVTRIDKVDVRPMKPRRYDTLREQGIL